MKRFALFAVPALVAGLAGCSGAPSKAPADEPVVVRVAPVTMEKMSLPVYATGTLGPKEDVSLSFKIDGVVARVFVNEGDVVRAGQMLATLDLREIDAAVTRARAAAEKATRDHGRLTRLYADSVVSLEQLEDSGTARDAAQAAYDAAAFNRSHAMIVAPAAGVILRRRVEPGEVVSAGTPLLGFGSRGRGQVMRAGLADRDIVRIALGDPAVVRLDAYPDRVFEGRVTEIGAAADPITGTYGVEVALPGAAGLPSGLVGSLEILPRAGTQVAVVPVESVLEADGDRATVYILDAEGRHAERRDVRLAFLAGDRVAVASGLDDVREVVTEGAGRLGPGDRVEVAR